MAGAASLLPGTPPTLPALLAWLRRRPMAVAIAIAIGVHGFLILGVGFRMPEPRLGPTRPLQVMIVTQAGPAPAREDPNAVAAQTARIGETNIPLPELDQSPPDATAPIAPETEPAPIAEPAPEPTPSELAIATAPAPVLQPPPDPTPEPPPEPPPEPTPEAAPDILALDSPARPPLTASRLRDSRAAEIARLTSRIQEQGASYDSRARRRAISTATREFKYATYMEGWRRKVERIGNLNYPAEAKRLGIYGQLILHVAVRADGSLEAVRVVRSSGHPELDQAAVRIVELAAPYAPFPADIRAETDVLDITRTWQFQRNNRLDGGN